MIASRKPTASKTARLLAIVLLPVGAALLLYSYAPYDVGRDSSIPEARATISMADPCEPSAYDPSGGWALCGVCPDLRLDEGGAFCVDPCPAPADETAEGTHLEIRSCAYFIVIEDDPAPPSSDDGVLEPGLVGVDDASTSAPQGPGPQKLIAMIGGLLVSIAGGASAVIAVRAAMRSSR